MEMMIPLRMGNMYNLAGLVHGVESSSQGDKD